MKSKMFIYIFLLFPAVLPSEEQRTLVKLQFAQREIVLRGMRNNLGALEKILSALSRKDFLKVEQIATTMILNEDRLKRLATRENDQFISAAMEFHTTGVIEVIKAARKKSTEATLLSLSAFVGKCNSCHATFRLIEWPAIDYPPTKPKALKAPNDYKRSDWVKKEFENK